MRIAAAVLTVTVQRVMSDMLDSVAACLFARAASEATHVSNTRVSAAEGPAGADPQQGNGQLLNDMVGSLNANQHRV